MQVPGGVHGNEASHVHLHHCKLRSTQLTPMAARALLSGSMILQDVVLQVCQVTCTANENFQQHLDSRKHQRNAASAAAAEVDLRQAAAAAAAAQLGQQLPAQLPSSTSPAPHMHFDPGDLPEDAPGSTTYLGPEANCRTYCCQVRDRLFDECVPCRTMRLGAPPIVPEANCRTYCCQARDRQRNSFVRRSLS